MRWMTFKSNGVESFGYVSATASGDEHVVDVAGNGYESLKDAIAADALGALAEVAGPQHSLGRVEFCPVITQPNKILCAGLNYHAHREETGRGDGDSKPTIFTRFAAAHFHHMSSCEKHEES